MKNKELEVLNFIMSFMLTNGVIPTIREIGKGVNLKSTSSVYSHILKLAESGDIVLYKSNGRATRYCVKGIHYVQESGN